MSLSAENAVTPPENLRRRAFFLAGVPGDASLS